MVRFEMEDVLKKTRTRYKEIGHYKAHELSYADYYKVTPDNGTILLFTAEIKDRHNLLPGRLSDIAARFSPAKNLSETPSRP